MWSLGYLGKIILLILISIAFLFAADAQLCKASGEATAGVRTSPSLPEDNWTFRAPEYFPPSGLRPAGIGIEDIDLAVGSDGSVHAVWEEAQSRVMYSVRPAGSTGFQRPVRLSAPSEVATQPQIKIGPDGIVHVVWIGRSLDDPINGGCATDADLVWTFSGDRGMTWAGPRVMMTDPLYGPSLGVLTNGDIAVSVWDWFPGNNQTEPPEEEGYKVLFLAWLQDGRMVHKRVITQVCSYATRQHQLLVSGTGNPHILVRGEDRFANDDAIDWYRSLDEGLSWDNPTFISVWGNPLHPWRFCMFKGVVLDDDHMVTASTIYVDYSSFNGPLDYYYTEICVHSRSVGEGSLVGSWTLPSAFSIEVRNGTIWFAALHLYNGSNSPDIQGPYYAEIDCHSLRLNGSHLESCHRKIQNGIMLFDDDIQFQMRENFCLDLALESNGQPVIALTDFNGLTGPSGAYIWRVNHPPAMPKSLSEASGGWVLGNWTSLRVAGSIDIDGDPVSYRFYLEPEGRLAFPVSDWQREPFSFAEDLHHGRYRWYVFARDPYNASLNQTGIWWFQADTGPPMPEPGGPYLGDEGSEVVLDGSFSTDDGRIVLWEWDVDGDGDYEFKSSRATMVYLASDEFYGLIQLRVTDEAGRQSVAWTPMIIMNVAPSVSISGPSTISGAAVYTVYVSHPFIGGNLTIQWCVDGIPTDGGLKLYYVPARPGEHIISVLVTDRNGGSSLATIGVFVKGPGGHVCDIEAPSEAIEGRPYSVRATNLTSDDVDVYSLVWMRDGKTIGMGPEASPIAAGPGIERVSVGLIMDGAFVQSAVTSLRIIARLLPVTCVQAEATAIGALTVTWTKCEQPDYFERYIVRISDGPLPLQPDASLDWIASLGSDEHFPINITMRSTTQYEFRGLKANTLYCLCVYVEGDHMVSCSNTVFGRTPLEPSPEGQGIPTSGEGKRTDLLSIVVISVIVALCSIPSVGILLLRRRENREGRYQGKGRRER